MSQKFKTTTMGQPTAYNNESNSNRIVSYKRPRNERNNIRNEKTKGLACEQSNERNTNMIYNNNRQLLNN